MKKTALTIIALALAVSVPVLPTVAAAPAAPAPAPKPPVAAEPAEEAHTPVKIPDTLPAVWKAVKMHEEELAATIKAKKLAEVHGHAFDIRDLVNALASKSKALDAANLAKVTANAKFVASLADRLDESGDAKDQAATEANFKKLQDILKTIEALYPPALLKADMTAAKP